MADVELVIKWSGKEFPLKLKDTDTVGEAKRLLEQQTGVQPKRQKLLGLNKKENKKPADDDTPLAEVLLKAGAKIMMMGTPETVLQAAQAEAEAAPEIKDDFDISEHDESTLEVKDRPEVQEKLARRLRSVEVKILNPMRPGKKCLVLDIDYTLFDLNSTAERPEELARPYLHEFLAACWEFYDIIIWSATSMKWVEVKMKELGVLGHPAYKLVAMLDHAAMLTVSTEKYGVFDCKPLQFIWQHPSFQSNYTEDNTVMLDDLRRNYIMNRQAGLVIRPYRKAHLTRGTDRELYNLTRYLCHIARNEKISHLDHRRWEKYLIEHGA